MFVFNLQGPSSKNPLSFKWYNPEEEILGKKMKVGVSYIFQEVAIFIYTLLSTYTNRILTLIYSIITAGLVQI